MKIDTTKILLIIVILLLGWQNFFKSSDPVIPQPITVTLPETSGTTGRVDLEQPVKREVVYIKGSDIPAEVDSKYKALYEQAVSELEKRDLYLDAITVRKYNDTLIDNEDITIKGEAETRGTLLNYDVKYTIKEKSLTYTPEVVSQFPKLTAGLGMELAIPTIPNTNFAVKANLSFMNQKGHEIQVSYDTEQRVWLGYKYNFKLIK